MKLPDTKAFYQSTGAKLRGRLRCEKCGRVQPCEAEDAAKYLRRGWPECCGETMTLETEQPQ